MNESKWKFAKCRCGHHEYYGEREPAACIECERCGTNIAFGPTKHGKPKPHKFIAFHHENSDGAVVVDKRCKYCYRTELEVANAKKAKH